MIDYQSEKSEQAASPAMGTIRAAFSHKPFVVAVLIMVVAAFGIGVATQFMQLKFRKVPVPLARPLGDVPQKLGPWVLVDEQQLNEDMEHTLGTKQYIFRYYVDTRAVGTLKAEEIISKIGEEKQKAISELARSQPRALINVGVTYYTGGADTVAHVPDRCYIADGYIPTAYETRTWKLGGNKDLGVRFITFDDATGIGASNRVTKNVAYFFQVNGELASDPIQVRVSLQNLFKADVYYAKVELMSARVGSRDEAARLMTDFLTHALPEIQKCLPQAGQAPAASAVAAAVSR